MYAHQTYKPYFKLIKNIDDIILDKLSKYDLSSLIEEDSNQEILSKIDLILQKLKSSEIKETTINDDNFEKTSEMLISGDFDKIIKQEPAEKVHIIKDEADKKPGRKPKNALRKL
jgi:hypothetical protein